MILYLLFPALILGIVESQTANATLEEPSKAEWNQTSINSTTKADNVTSSLYKEKTDQIEDELKTNQTSVITEDDERFQDQETEFPAKHCQQDALVQYSHIICGADFHEEMHSISTENWCVLEKIIRPYHKVSKCMELLSNMLGCYYPNSNTQDFFLHIHSYYFQNCSMKEEFQFEDAPHGLVITLTIIPVSLIPVLVYQLVRKSKVYK